MGWICALSLVWTMCGLLGAWVSSQMNRESIEGLFLGFLFGPFGVLIAALVPSLPPQGVEAKAQAQSEYQEAMYAAWRKEEEKHQEAMREADEKRARAKVERAAWVEEKRQARRELYESKGIDPDGSFRWLGLLYQDYQDLPDWLQPILLGLAIAVPVVGLIVLWARAAIR